MACGRPFEVVPWEHPEVGHWLTRWWRTCLMGMRTPDALFRTLRPKDRLGSAMLFFTVCAVVQGPGALLVTAMTGGGLLQGAVGSSSLSPALEGLLSGQGGSAVDLFPTGRPANAPPESAPPEPDAPPAVDLDAVVTVVSMVSSVYTFFSAFFALITIAVVFHLGALLFVPKRGSFSDTLTATAYAHAPVLVTLVPMIGGLVFLFWMSYLLVIGLKEVHHTTGGRVVLALSFVPVLAVVGLGGCAFALITQLSSSLAL
jgi:hypothetical protein